MIRLQCFFTGNLHGDPEQEAAGKSCPFKEGKKATHLWLWLRLEFFWPPPV